LLGPKNQFYESITKYKMWLNSNGQIMVNVKELMVQIMININILKQKNYSSSDLTIPNLIYVLAGF